MNAILIKILYNAALKLAGEAAAEVSRLVRLAESELSDKTGAEKKAWLMAELKRTRAWLHSRLMTLPSTLTSAIVDVLVAWTKVGQK